MDNSTSLWLKQIRRRQELMDSVMEKCGVDVLKAVRAANGDGFFAARGKCRDCVREEDCRNWWLNASELPPNFCPNADFFRACKREDHPLNEHLTQRCGTVIKRRHQRPTASFEQRASSELLKLIWKLRWLGEETEANKALMQLTRILARMQVLARAPCTANNTLGMVNDTD
jgi:Family of unknown function (DUF6455)